MSNFTPDNMPHELRAWVLQQQKNIKNPRWRAQYPERYRQLEEIGLVSGFWTPPPAASGQPAANEPTQDRRRRKRPLPKSDPKYSNTTSAL